MKKIRIFLGAYVNYPNAQNINCDNIAKYLDKSKFEVHTMYTDSMPINKDEYERQGIHLHRLIHHRFIWWWCKYLTMLFGKYDIYYLPKREPMDIFFAKKHPGMLCVSSVEGVITRTINNTELNREYHTEIMKSSFAISLCIADSVKTYWNVDLPVLPLGVVKKDNTIEEKMSVKRIIWAGNIKSNKRPQYLVECAKHFPYLSFCMIGDGDMQDDLMKQCEQEGIKNISFTGRIPNHEVYEVMSEGDLLLMTSEYEGLPKVIQEAAQCRLPAIYINENYTVDFIEDGVNGYGVPTIEEMMEKIQYLIEHPDIYKQMSYNAYHIIQDYTWDKLIEKYQKFFITQYEKRND